MASFSGDRDRFELKVQLAVSAAMEHCRSAGPFEITPLEVLRALLELRDPDIELVFLSARVDSQAALAKLSRGLSTRPNDSSPQQSDFSAAMNGILDDSMSLSSKRYSSKVTALELFFSIITSPGMEELLAQIDLKTREIREYCWKLFSMPNRADSEDKATIKDLRLQLEQAVGILYRVNIELLRLQERTVT